MKKFSDCYAGYLGNTSATYLRMMDELGGCEETMDCVLALQAEQLLKQQLEEATTRRMRVFGVMRMKWEMSTDDWEIDTESQEVAA